MIAERRARVRHVRNPWHVIVEALLPWYDPKAEKERDERTERIAREAREARIEAVQVQSAFAKVMKPDEVREAYRLSAGRTQR